MSRITKRVLVPYSADQMYDLVNEAETYPQFLPWCDKVHIISRDEMQVRAKVGISKGRVRQSFITQNQMIPGKRIEMKLVEGPFRKMHGVWHFSPRGDSGCEIAFDMEFEFASGLLGFGFGKIFSGIANTLVEAFIQRAKQIYG